MGRRPAAWSFRWPFAFDEPVVRYFLLAGIPYFFTEHIVSGDRKVRRLEDLTPRRFIDMIQVTLLVQPIRGAAVIGIAVVLFGALRVPQPSGTAATWLYALILWPFFVGLPLLPTLKSLPDESAVRRWRFVLVRWSPLLSIPPAVALAYVIARSP